MFDIYIYIIRNGIFDKISIRKEEHLKKPCYIVKCKTHTTIMVNLSLNVPRNRVGKIIIRNTCILSFRFLNVVISLRLIRCFYFYDTNYQFSYWTFYTYGDNRFLITWCILHKTVNFNYLYNFVLFCGHRLISTMN